MNEQQKTYKLTEEERQRRNETRKRNEAARMAEAQKRKAERQEVKAGLLRVVNSEDATAEQRLEAARLILEVEKLH